MNMYVTGTHGGMGQALLESIKHSATQWQVFSIQSRLENVVELEKEVQTLLQSNPPDALINLAGFGIFRPHEELSVRDIQMMVAVNLTAPMLLAHWCLRSLKERQGHIVHIASIEAVKQSRWAALYGATKAGLRQFSLNLFEEVRKAGVKVTCINPDLTRTKFFDTLDFEPEQGREYAIEPSELAKTLLFILSSPEVICDLTIRPRQLGIRKKRNLKESN